MKVTSNGNLFAVQRLQQSIQKKYNVDVSKEEKKFFAKLYPNQKSEIMEYHYYNKSGKLSGVQIGSQIDRRG